MRISSITGADDYIGITAQALLNQIVMHGTTGKQRVNRLHALGNIMVRQNTDDCAIANFSGNFFTDTLDSLFEIFLFNIIVKGEFLDRKLIEFVALDGIVFTGRKYRARQTNTLPQIRVLFEHALLATQFNTQRHNNGFTKWIDRRISYLSKLLTEIIEGITMLGR